MSHGNWSRIDFLHAAIRDGRMIRAGRAAMRKAAAEAKEGKAHEDREHHGRCP